MDKDTIALPFSEVAFGTVKQIPLSQVWIDPRVYPRHEVDISRASEYAACMRDNAQFPPIEVQEFSDEETKAPYRVLDGGHRYEALRMVGSTEAQVIIVDLKDESPIRYAARRAIGPMRLKDKDAEKTARAIFEQDPTLTAAQIARDIGRPNSTVYDWVKDLLHAQNLSRDVAMIRMHRLGLPLERVAERLGFEDARSVHRYFGEFPDPEKRQNASSVQQRIEEVRSQLSRGIDPAKVAEKEEWPEPLVWSLALEGKDDYARFTALKWPIRTWDDWRWNDCDKRFGDEWPGRIPAQLVAHTLFYFTQQENLILDPMAGGGVVPDVCLALNRRCWAFDLDDRKDTRPEIEPHQWVPGSIEWPCASKFKPDLIFWDPPYWDKMKDDYSPDSISALDREAYMEFFREWLAAAEPHIKKTTRLAFLNSDCRDFQGKTAMEEVPSGALSVIDYAKLLESCGWGITHLMDTPMSTERFSATMVKRMQERRAIGVVRRTLLMARRDT